jgi:hypothetical protein
VGAASASPEVYVSTAEGYATRPRAGLGEGLVDTIVLELDNYMTPSQRADLSRRIKRHYRTVRTVQQRHVRVRVKEATVTRATILEPACICTWLNRAPQFSNLMRLVTDLAASVNATSPSESDD